MRLLAAYLPGFPLQVAVRASPSLEYGRVAFAVADTVLDAGKREIHSGATLLSVSARARAAGVRAGMTVAQGRAACRGLVVRPLEPAAHEVARIALAEVLSGFGPRVEVLGSGSTRQPWEAGLVDVSGTRPPEEPALAREAADALARAGLVARVAIASTRFCARTVAASTARAGAASRGGPLADARDGTAAPTIVAPGDERAALRDLPVDALPLDARATEAFAALSIRTLGDLARLPPDTLARRFGGHSAVWTELARGIDPSPMVPFRIPAALFERVDLGEPVEQLEGLVFSLRVLFERVCARLTGRGRAAAKVALHLVLEEWDKPAPAANLEIRLPKPTVAARTMLEVARERLGNLSLPGPVREMAVEVLDSVPTRTTQLELFSKAPPAQGGAGPAWRPRGGGAPTEAGSEKLAVTLGRLASAFGEGSVFAAALADEHRPEHAWTTAPFDERAGGERGAGSEGGRRPAERMDPGTTAREAPPLADAPRPTRLLATPEPVQLGRTGPQTPPSAGAPRKAERERAPELIVRGQRLAVVAMEGPERLAGDGWDAGSAYERDYYRIATEEGSRWWVFYDRRGGGWHLHGLFD